MNEQDKGAFASAMTGLAENFGQSFTKAGLRMRFEALRQYPIEDVQRAAMSLLANRKYTSMPTVADFIEHLSGGPVEDVAEREAGKVLEAIRSVGAWRSVAFDDPVTQAVIEQGHGGWVKLCEEMTDDKLNWFRKDFVRTYASYKRQGVKQPGHLAGLVEIHNGARGLAHREPLALVGNPQQALAIAQTPTERPMITTAEDGPRHIGGALMRAIPCGNREVM